MAPSLTSAMMLKALLHRYHGEGAEALASSLSEERRRQLKSLPPLALDEEGIASLLVPEETLAKVHYSWLAPLVEQYPSRMQPLILGSLSREQGAKLSELLAIKVDSSGGSPPLKAFLARTLWDRLKPKKGVAPLAFLPQTPLSGLLLLDKERLVILCDYFSLYDFGDTLRHIVDKGKLKSLLACLDKQEQRFLRSCMHSSGGTALPGFDLEGWKGEKSKLRHMLHRRGLLRLAKALSGCDEAFFWHLVHRFDTGRGALLLKDHAKEEIPGLTDQLRPQLLTIMNFMTPKKEAP